MKRIIRRARGFSLIEVIFAIAMLGIGIVGILSLFTAGLTSASKSQNSSNASMEVQSLLTRILTESDSTKPVAKRKVLDYIHMAGEAPGLKKNEWIQFDENMSFTGANKAVRIDSRRDLFWKCRCLPVKSDKDVTGNVVDWFPPMNPDDPLDTAYQDKSVSGNYVNGLYEIAIAIYRTQKDDVPDAQKPIAVYTTFVTAGF
jgi:prepilin-type N-terminal cleavage/methylation domain-containing protein